MATDDGIYSVVGGDLQVDFDRAGRVSLVHRVRSGHVFLEQRAQGASVWRLVLRDRRGEPRTVTVLDAAACAVEPCGAGLRWSWSEIAGASGMSVHATVVPQGDRLLWRLSVDGLTPDVALWQVDFPVLSGLRPMAEGDDERLLLPRAGGFVVRNPSRTIFGNRDRGHKVSLAYPGGMTMQFVACYRQRGDGLLAMALDPDGYYKRFSAQGEQGADTWTLAVEHYPAGMPQSEGRYAMPYAVALTAFTGDWPEAAELYRSWAIAQPWCRHGPLYSRSDLPRWLLDTGLWVWNRGRSDQVLPGALQLRRLVEAPVALDWYWWHRTPYDTHFPDYLPPREGADGFQAAVADLHAHDLHAIVYVNGRLWGTGAPSWESRDARRAACKREDGDIYREVYNVFNGAEMAPMCPAAGFWQQTLRDVVDELVNRYGVDGVYIDQIGIASPQLCFDAQHDHPAGGGNHWRQGYRRLVEQVRRSAQARPDAMFPTEGSCEAYLDLFDAFLVLDNSFERMGFYGRIGLNWEPVPLFAAVYHDYALHFGSYASLAPPPYDELWPQPAGPLRSPRFRERDFVDAFYAELGRAFVAGAQPMVANFHPEQADDPELQQHWRFLRELVQVRLQAAPFLVYGRWLRPPELSVPEITVDFLARGIYTPPDREHVVRRRLPSVLASLWAAPDGRRGLALANISCSPQAVSWRVEDARPGQTMSRMDGHGHTQIARAQGDHLVYAAEVPARSVQVIEVSP